MKTRFEWDLREPILWRIFFITLGLSGLVAAFIYSLKGVGFYILGGLFLAAEFKSLVLVGKLMLGALRPSFFVSTSIFSLKICLWIGLATAPMWLPEAMVIAFCLGCFAFMIAMAGFLGHLLCAEGEEKPDKTQ